MRDLNLQLYEMFQKTQTDSINWQLAALDQGQRARRVMFLNAHGVNLAAQHPSFRTQLLASDHLLRDGIGVAFGLGQLNLEPTENLNGTDLIPLILQAHKDKRIAVWGSSEAALEKLEKRLTREGYTNVVSYEHGFHDDAFYVSRYEALNTDILILCMGMPRQELLSQQLVETGTGGMIICGGGWANFYSGHSKRAPRWVQRLRLEWVHRLLLNPIRLGKRYTVDIVTYFLLVKRIASWQKNGQKRH